MKVSASNTVERSSMSGFKLGIVRLGRAAGKVSIISAFGVRVVLETWSLLLVVKHWRKLMPVCSISFLDNHKQALDITHDLFCLFWYYSVYWNSSMDKLETVTQRSALSTHFYSTPVEVNCYHKLLCLWERSLLVIIKINFKLLFNY